MRHKSDPIRVAIVCPTFGGYGGLEAFAATLSAGLQSSPQYDVRLVMKRVAGFVQQRELRDLLAPLGSRATFAARGSTSLWRSIANVHVVHALNPMPDAVLFARLLRRPLLINVINHRGMGHSWRQRLWDAGLKQAQRRFYISDYVRRTWEGEFPWLGSHVVFPICELAGDIEPVSRRCGFAFAARWIENKGLEVLIEAYAQAELDPLHWPLVLVGDGPLRAKIERRAAELGSRGIVIRGFVSAEEKAAIIRGARWMVIPPHTNEDFGLTAIEARHLGVPCIATRDGGLPEAAGRDAILCTPGCVADLCRALREAAGMDEAEYMRRALRTKEELDAQLAQPVFYGEVYRELAA